MRATANPPNVLETFTERLEAVYGTGVAERILGSMLAPKRAGYFRNPLVEWHFEPLGAPIAGLDGCFSVAPEDRQLLLETEAVKVGAVYPINPSSVLAVSNLEVTGVAEVLDLAAAPGGKTLLMASAMGNLGRIAAVEPVKGRFHRMRANLDRCGVTNVQFYQTDGRTIGRKVPERFDRVLLDAPCSSESRIRLDDPTTYAHWKPRKIRECARKQRGLIRSGYASLKPGGELLYCTCAFAPEENELIVDYLLANEASAEVLPVRGHGLPGRLDWQGRSLDERMHLTQRILPDDLWDGFYLARIRKRD
jgi:16S rRNA (cytosine1407-C5)-methyltransferase